MISVRHSTRKMLAGGFLAFLLFLAVVAPTQKAYAQGEELGTGAAACAGSAAIQQLIGAALSAIGLQVPIKDPGNDIKDQIMDCLAWVTANIVLEEITDATLTWINSGFDGNPAYVEDFGGFIRDTADEAAGAFIESTDLAFLCSPFQLEVKLALLTSQQGFRNESRCTLTDVVENTEDFLAGDFTQGGWRGWFELTQRPQNNPYGAYLLASDELNQQIAARVDEQKRQFEVGRGFLGKEVCTTYVVCEEQPSDFVGPPICNETVISADEILPEQLETARCVDTTILTPGSVIEQQLEGVLEIGGRRLEVADELDEVLTALLNYLLTEVLTGDGGLRGIGEFLDTAERSELPDEIPLPGGTGTGTGLFCSQTDPSPGTGTVTVNIPNHGDGTLSRNLNLTGHYTHADLSFDFFLNQIGPIPPGEEKWQTIVSIRGMGNPAVKFFRILVAEDGDSIVSLIDNAIGDEWLRQGPDFKENTWYRVTATYDAGVNITVVISERGGGEVARITGIPANSIFPFGGGAHLILNDNGSGANAKPLRGVKYEDVRLTLTPGAAVCGGGSPLPPGGGGDDDDDIVAQCGPYLNVGGVGGDFLLGVSYYGGAGESTSQITSDMNRFADLGFNNVRVWATWTNDFAPNSQVVDFDGSLNSTPLSRLKHLIGKADDNNISVDVTFKYSNKWTFNNYRRGIENLARELRSYDNVFFDLANEHNCPSCSDGRHLTTGEIDQLADAVRAVDSDRLLTASIPPNVGGPGSQASYYNSLYGASGIDFATPHFERDGGWASETGERVEEFRAALSAGNKNKPIHLQEENRNGWQGRNFSKSQFLQSLAEASRAGAAGWVFHNDAGYDLVNGNFFNQLDNTENDTIDELEGTLASNTCVEA